MLHGKRLRLRSIRNSDKTLFLCWFNDLNIVGNLGMARPISESEEEQWLKILATARRETDVIFVIELVRGSKAIGCASLNKINGRHQNAELSIVIGESRHWGHGYGSEAIGVILNYGFERINLHRIYTGAYDFNRASIRALEKNGFEWEGCQRQAGFCNGKFCDCLLFGLLRQDWRQRDPKIHP